MIKKCLNCDREIQVYTKRRLVRKFCNSTCLLEHRKKNGYWKNWYQNKETTKIRNLRRCSICERRIKEVGQKKNISKYCSDRCMTIAQGIRENGQKYVEVKMTLPQYRRYMGKSK